MPIKVQEIRTSHADAMVNRIKSTIRNRYAEGFSKEVPQEIAQKRIYMQTDEFWKDEHNVQMQKMYDKLIALRDKIAEEVAEKNKTAYDTVVQGINGLSRIKKYLDINPKMNFWDVQTFHSPAENEYNLLKKYQLRNLSLRARQNMQKNG